MKSGIAHYNSQNRLFKINGFTLSFVKFLHRGSGGLTSLYQDEIGNRFILKSTLGDNAKQEAEFNERLDRLACYEPGEDNWDNLVLKYVEGIDLDEYLTKAALSAWDKINIAIHLVLAQERLFKLNIVHNDLQLANFVICHHDGEILIEGIDFGAATDICHITNQTTIKAIMHENVLALIDIMQMILPVEVGVKLFSLEDDHNLDFSLLISKLKEELRLENNVQCQPSCTPLFNCSSKQPNQRMQQFVKDRLRHHLGTQETTQASTFLAHCPQLDKAIDELSAKTHALKISSS
jgi:serine/threonine protein kinase